MNKNWKLTCIGLAIVLAIATMTVLDTKVYEIEQTERDHAVVEKIESDKGVVVLENFDANPAHVRFLEGDLIEIDGHHTTYGNGVYQVDLSEMTVQQVEGLSNLDPQTYTEVLKSSLGLILTKQDGSAGLYHQALDGELKRISGNFIPTAEKSVKLSANGEKLIYLVRESKQMATYSLRTSKKKVVPGNLPDAVVENFDRNVELSPDGGYFMIFNSSGEYGEHTLNVYGADSGRKYADEIQGTSPKWSPDGKRLSFVYSGALSTPALLTDTRVGYMKFPEREIVYFDNVSDQYVINDEMYWNASSTTLSYLRQSIEQQTNEFRSYDVSNGSIYSFDFGSKGDQLPSDVSIAGDKIVLYWNDDQVMQVLDLGGLALSQKERIDTIGMFEQATIPFSHNDQQLIFYRDNKLIIQTELSRELLKIDGLREVVASSESSWVVAGVMENESFKLKIVSRK